MANEGIKNWLSDEAVEGKRLSTSKCGVAVEEFGDLSFASKTVTLLPIRANLIHLSVGRIGLTAELQQE